MRKDQSDSTTWKTTTYIKSAKSNLTFGVVLCSHTIFSDLALLPLFYLLSVNITVVKIWQSEAQWLTSFICKKLLRISVKWQITYWPFQEFKAPHTRLLNLLLNNQRWWCTFKVREKSKREALTLTRLSLCIQQRKMSLY